MAGDGQTVEGCGLAAAARPCGGRRGTDGGVDAARGLLPFSFFNFLSSFLGSFIFLPIWCRSPWGGARGSSGHAATDRIGGEAGGQRRGRAGGRRRLAGTDASPSRSLLAPLDYFGLAPAWLRGLMDALCKGGSISKNTHRLSPATPSRQWR